MKKHALLVGVEDYRDKMISRLNFARADATALAERLSERCGFDSVRVLADEGGEDEPLLVNIITALRDTSADLRQDDLFLFFFAGHGIEKDGHGYLLARDSLQAFPEHGSLSLKLLRKTFEHLIASKRILLLDACRNSPEASRSDASNCMGDAISRDIVAAARTNLSSSTTTILFSACRTGQRAYEWPAKGHGTFSHFLLEGIDEDAWEGRKLDFRKLASMVASRVREWSGKTAGIATPQEPWYEEFGNPESLIIGLGGQPRKRSGKTSPSQERVDRPKSAHKPPAKSSKSAVQPGARNRKPSVVTADTRFTCPVCGEPSDADGGDLCPQCNRFVHEGCQECIKVRKSVDWGCLMAGLCMRVLTYACPLCGSVVRKKKVDE